MSLRNYIDKTRKYFWFSREELKALVIGILGGAFIYSWNKWGTEAFNAGEGVISLLTAMVLVGVALFIHHSGQRLLALFLGFKAEQKLSWYGFAIGLLIAMLSKGTIKIIAVSSTAAYLLPIHRLGAFRHGLNLATLTKILLAGPIFNAGFALLAHGAGIIGIISTSLARELFILNAIIAVCNMLPIPPLDGFKIFYTSPLFYVFWMGSFSAFAILGYLMIYSASIALFAGALTALCFAVFKGE